MNRVALAKVREDKERESATASTAPGSRTPISCRVATEVFDAVLGERPNQLERLREDVVPTRRRCSRSPTRPARSPTPGLRTNVSVGVRYLDAWLHGVGAAAIDNLMEDAATAEISRSQVWQWVRARALRRASAYATRSRRSRPATRPSSSSPRSRSSMSWTTSSPFRRTHSSGVTRWRDGRDGSRAPTPTRLHASWPSALPGLCERDHTTIAEAA